MFECCQISSFAIPLPLLCSTFAQAENKVYTLPLSALAGMSHPQSSAHSWKRGPAPHHSKTPKPVSFPCSLKPFETNLGGLLCSLKHLFCNSRHTSFYCTLQIKCFTNWRFVTSLPQASLWAPFFQQHLITLCLCVTFWYSQNISDFFNIITLLWWSVSSDFWCHYCNCFGMQTAPIKDGDLNW